MTEIIRDLYYSVDDWAERQYAGDPEAKALLDRRQVLQDQIILRLGKDGQDMMEALADLNLQLKDIHDEALFRAAVGLGARLVRP